MQTFQEFLKSESNRGGVNLLFESAMYSLIDELDRIVKILSQAKLPFQLIGGMAVNAHLLASQQRSRTFVTKDIDLLVQRSDLPAIVQAAEAAGYSARKIMGGFMLIWPGQQPAEAVRLIFVGERSKSTNPLPHPSLNAQTMQVFGVEVPVAALVDLVRMKLNSSRAKDLVHLETLDACGMITPAIEQQLPSVLRERLVEARKQFAKEQPDVE